ncbi:MAG TPA: outer membrane lipid asymmetry maintenance protein MlaD, partial [Rhodanobacteraceae bacterium]|nr:outer membrane lipid asymmetry maintenance protein MlaD [Rhodanobacteraceae bacterium]
LLGDQYVGIQPGGSPDFLKNGDEMILTQSAMSIENLIGKFLVNGGPKPGGSAPASSAAPASGKP